MFMKIDIFKVMILHKDQIVRKIIKEEILKILPHTLFVTASTKNSFLKKIGWITPDLVLSSTAESINFGLEALLYVRKNLSDTPFVYITDQKQLGSKSLSLILAEADGTINHTKTDQISEVMNGILPRIKQRKRFRSVEIFELHQKLMLVQKSIALSTKGYFLPQQEALLNTLLKKQLDKHVL